VTDSAMHRRIQAIAKYRARNDKAMARAVWMRCWRQKSDDIRIGEVFRIELDGYVGPYFRALKGGEVECAEEDLHAQREANK
jgi:hypothetical protein